MSQYTIHVPPNDKEITRQFNISQSLTYCPYFAPIISWNAHKGELTYLKYPYCLFDILKDGTIETIALKIRILWVTHISKALYELYTQNMCHGSVHCGNVQMSSNMRKGTLSNFSTVLYFHEINNDILRQIIIEDIQGIARILLEVTFGAPLHVSEYEKEVYNRCEKNPSLSPASIIETYDNIYKTISQIPSCNDKQKLPLFIKDICNILHKLYIDKSIL